MKNPKATFAHKKQAILKELAKPDDLYSDLSPKGAIDPAILDLVHDINSYEGLVTTSSCSGRISVFVEGIKGRVANETDDEKSIRGTGAPERSAVASDGGKGGGGRWLYVSHEPLHIASNAEHPNYTSLFGFEFDCEIYNVPIASPEAQRFVHFKFEPMILHILAASPEEAHHVLAAAHDAGFRESGAASLPVDSNSASQYLDADTSPIPIAIRTTGLAFDNIIGLVIGAEQETLDRQNLVPLVSENQIRTLVGIANVKFQVNLHRRRRFGELLAARMSRLSSEPVQREGAAARKRRKQREGLERQKILHQRQRFVSGDEAQQDRSPDGVEFLGLEWTFE